MAINVNKAYMQKLSETPASNLPSVSGERFMVALEKTYGAPNVQKAMQWIMNPETERKFGGMKPFKDRVVSAISGTATLSGEDQKYIDNIVFRTVNGLIAPVKL
jgi:hypothetical protein